MTINQPKRPWIRTVRQSSSTDGFYQSTQWRRIVTAFWKGFWEHLGERVSNRLCRDCFKKGIVKLAKYVDHIIQRKLGGSDENDNLQGLCSSCHNSKSAQEGNQMRKQ
jgi:5-methylcytosine-specific restriction endonuclease McrA